MSKDLEDQFCHLLVEPFGEPGIALFLADREEETDEVVDGEDQGNAALVALDLELLGKGFEDGVGGVEGKLGDLVLEAAAVEEEVEDGFFGGGF